MKIIDMMKPDGRVFLKSEWGVISDDWPCVSFTKKSVGDKLRAEFRPGRDVLVYVGTTNPENTPDAAHRSRMLSATVIQPKQVLMTQKLVPAEVWTAKVGKWGNRWPYAMAVTRAANVLGDPLPHAREVAPSAYRAFSAMENRGSIVEAAGNERAAVMAIDVEEITLHLPADVRNYIKLAEAVAASDVDANFRQEVGRMAVLIESRVKNGGELNVRVNPQRFAPNISDLIVLLTTKWTEQRGLCLLCGGRLAVGGSNPMLQPSADRIDSDNGAYHVDNVQITHLACNLAKNKYGSADFLEWLDTIRSEDDTE